MKRKRKKESFKRKKKRRKKKVRKCKSCKNETNRRLKCLICKEKCCEKCESYWALSCIAKGCNKYFCSDYCVQDGLFTCMVCNKFRCIGCTKVAECSNCEMKSCSGCATHKCLYCDEMKCKFAECIYDHIRKIHIKKWKNERGKNVYELLSAVKGECSPMLWNDIITEEIKFHKVHLKAMLKKIKKPFNL